MLSAEPDDAAVVPQPASIPDIRLIASSMVTILFLKDTTPFFFIQFYAARRDFLRFPGGHFLHYLHATMSTISSASFTRRSETGITVMAGLISGKKVLYTSLKASKSERFFR